MHGKASKFTSQLMKGYR